MSFLVGSAIFLEAGMNDGDGGFQKECGRGFGPQSGVPCLPGNFTNQPSGALVSVPHRGMLRAPRFDGHSRVSLKNREAPKKHK